MTRATSHTSLTHASRPAAFRLGERLRQLRVAAGMTQSELAGERFSKEYVSQIERGKTRPTSDTIAWLASRLEVDAGYLANGVSTDRRGRAGGALSLGRGLGKDAARRAARGAGTAHARAPRRRRRAFLGSRSRRSALPGWRLPLQALEHLDRHRSLQRGLHAGRAIRAPV